MKGCLSILFISAFLAILASLFGRGYRQNRVEDLLTERVRTGLKEEYPVLDIRYDHLTAIVEGDVSEERAGEIRAKVSGLSKGNGRVHFVKVPTKQVALPKVEKTPASFTILRSKDELTLTGTVSSAEAKNTLADALAKSSGLTVHNNLSVGENTKAFPSFEHAIATVPSLVSAARNGRIDASPEKVVVSGTVDSNQIRDNLLTMFTTEKWNGAAIDDQIIVQVPRNQSPEFNYAKIGNTVTLTGTVDSEPTKEALLKAAQTEGLTVIDELKISEKVKLFPALAGATAFPALLQATEDGSVKLQGKKLELIGLVKSRPIKNSILANYQNSVWDDYDLVDRIEVKPIEPPVVEFEAYNFIIDKTEDRVDLTGVVGSKRIKNSIRTAAALEGLTVKDELIVGDNITNLKVTGQLSSGIGALLTASKNAKIEAQPNKLILSGLVKSKSIKNDILINFSNQDWSQKAIVDRIKVMKPESVPAALQPVDFALTKNGQKIELSGVVDSEDTKSLLAKAVNSNDIAVTNGIKVGEKIKGLSSYNQLEAGIPALFNATEKGKIAINSERVVVAGLVKDRATKSEILDHFTSKKWGLKVVDQIKIERQKVSPILVWNQTAENELVLEGRVPNQKAVDSLVKSAKKHVGTEGKVVNKLKIQSDVREASWLSAFPVFAAQSLLKVDTAEMMIDDNSSSISGVVANSTVMNDVTLAFSGIDPPGKLSVDLRIAQPKVVEPVAPVRDKIPEVRIRGIGNRITATGNLPFPKSKKSVADSILGIEGIKHMDVEELAIGNDVKNENYLKPFPKFIRNYYSGAVRERQIWLKDQQLTLEGIVPNEKARKAAVELAKPMQSNGVKIINKIRVIDPVVIKPKEDPKAQPAVNPDKGELHSLYFGTNEYHIRDNQWQIANELLAKAKASSGKIIIEGFADERGSTELNEFLSDQRAKVIRSYLTYNGVDEKRIVSAVGRGAVSGGAYQQFRRTDVRILSE